MPKKFRAIQGDGSQFQCALQCATCGEPTKAGHPCKRRACHGMPVCWTHCQKLYHLRTGTSTIPHAGKGLFVKVNSSFVYPYPNDVVFRRGDWVCPYVGEHMTMQGIDARYGDDGEAPYSLCDGNQCVDAACKRGWGSFANHRAHANAENVQYVLRVTGRGNNRTREFWLKATKNIRNNDEILANYGNIYTMQNGSHSTR